MMRSMFLAIACIFLTANAFAPLQKATFVKAAVNRHVILKMSQDSETPPKVSTDGTFYDDEVRDAAE